MKKPFIILLLLCLFQIPTFIKAQNWQPIIKGYTYNYLLNNQQLPVYSIKVDSATKNSAGDSVYYLNNVYKECIKCAEEMVRIDNRDFNYRHKFELNQTQFLLNEVTFPSNNSFNFSADSQPVFSISNNNPIWKFDKNKNITASVTKTYDSTVFGLADSIKLITLSTGDHILLSKNNGILQFPFAYGSKKYYKLVGINEKKAGITIPGFKEFFDFEVGDKFEYRDEYVSWQGSYTNIRQYTITSKTQNADTLIYSYQGYIREKDKGRAFSGNLKYPYSILGVLDKNYHEVAVYDELNPFLNKNFNRYDTIGIDYDFTFNTYTKTHNMATSFLLLKPYNDSDFIVNLMLATDGDDYYTSYGAGLGMISFQHSSMSSLDKSVLVAYQNGSDPNDNFGTFTPDSIILSTINKKETPSENHFQIFPNPATSLISVINTSEEIKNINYQIYDLQGREVLSETGNSSIVNINISTLQNGIYILKIQEKEKNYIRKIIKN